jgi:hypothetical protein
MNNKLWSWGVAMLGLALLPEASHAQSIQEIRGVPQAPQVLPTEDQGYAVLYRSETGEDGQDVYAMRLLDPALKPRYQYMLNLPIGAAPMPRLLGKSSLALPFHDQSAARLSLYTFNLQSGKQLQRDLAVAPDRQRVPSGAPLLAVTPTEGYCVVQPFRRDTAGYTITMLDRDLKTQWSKMYFPTDLRQHVPLKVAVSKDVVTLVLADSYVLAPNTKEQRNVTDVSVLGLDRTTGKVLYRSPVRQDKLVLMPEQLLALADGRVAATGLYAMPQAAPRRDSVLGVFMTYYKADGRAGTPVLTPWAELGTRLNDPALGKRLYDRQASLQFQDLLTTTGTDTKLVGEYLVAGQPGPFVVLNYSAAGTLGSLYPVARTFKTAPQPNELRNSRYRAVIGRQGEPYLVYTGVEGTQEYAYATVLADAPTRSAARTTTSFEKLPELPAYTTERPMASSPAVDRFTSKLMALGDKMNSKVEAIDKVINGPQAPVMATYQPDQLTNFVVGPPGQVLVYRYEPSRKMLRMQVQPLK